MSERVVIVIEYEVDTDMQTALHEVMTQIREGRDHLNPEHVKIAGDVHVAIKDMADRVLAVFDPEQKP